MPETTVAQLEQQIVALAAALRTTEQQLSFHMQHTPLAYIAWNLDFEVTEWNPAAEQIFGYSKAEALGRHAAGLIVPEQYRAIVDQVWSDLLHLSGGTRSTNDNFTKSGQIITCDWYNAPLLDADGQVIGVISFVADITERLKAEAALRASDERFRQLIDQSADAFFLHTPEGKFLDVNQRACVSLGYTRDELLTMTVTDIEGGLAPDVLDPIWTQLAQGEPVTLEGMHLRKDGSTFPVEVRLARVDVPGGHAVSAVARDITERKAAEAEQRRLQEHLMDVQAATLAELSTPLIPISDTVMVMPLVGAIDSRRAQQVVEALLEGIATHRTAVVIVDITGVSVVDTQVANAILHAAQAVRLLGAEVLLTGIRPEVAQTLVGLGVDLQHIVTRATVQSGIAFALSRT